MTPQHVTRFTSEEVQQLTIDVTATSINEFITTDPRIVEIEHRMAARYAVARDDQDATYVQLEAERNALWIALTLDAMTVIRDFLSERINDYDHRTVLS